ncbi:MAG: M36 family metallopeptidase [bacterium]
MNYGSYLRAPMGYWRLITLSALVALAMSPAASHAIINGKEKRLDNFDVRYTPANAPAPMRAALRSSLNRQQTVIKGIQSGAESLKLRLPGLEIKSHAFLGVPERLRNSDGFMTPENMGETPDKIVRSFVSENSQLFGLNPATFDDHVKTTAAYQNPRTDLHWVTLEQQIGGIPVFGGELRAAVTGKGEVVSLVNSMAPGIDDESVLRGAPGITVEEAVCAAAKNLGYALAPANLVRKSGASDSSYTSFEPPKGYDKISTRQVIFPIAPGEVSMAWEVIITTSNEGYGLVISASDAVVLLRKDFVNQQTASATYEFYDADSPAPGLPWLDAPTTTPNKLGKQAPPIKRSTKTIVSEYVPGNPMGWIDDNDNFTRGNNTWTGRDQYRPQGIDVDVFDPGKFAMPYGNENGTSPNNRNFVFRTSDGNNWSPAPVIDGYTTGAALYPVSSSTGPTKLNEPYDSGALTNMFYWTNRYHDRLYELGFTEQARNFQARNFGRGGLESDPVEAQGMDYSGTDNSNFMTPPDGQSGRMQEYVFTGMRPDPYRDSSIANDVMVHELTHGLSNRIVGNAYGLMFQQAGGLGEGWSDFYSLALLSDYVADQDPNKTWPTGGWVTYKLGGMRYDNYYFGIRRFPYSTNLFISPLTWADAEPRTFLDIGAATNESPMCFSEYGASEVHNMGELYTAMLWQVRGRVMDYFNAGGSTWREGNQHTLQLVTDSLKLTPNNPSYSDARQSVIDAALAQSALLPFPSPDPVNDSFAAMDEIAIWRGFAARGLGYSAIAPKSDSQPNTTVEYDPKSYYTMKAQSLGDQFLFDVILTSTTLTFVDRMGEPADFESTQPSSAVRLYGKAYNEVYVNKNGSITFDGGDTIVPPTADLAQHFSQARISGLLSDLDPTPDPLPEGMETTPAVSIAEDAPGDWFIVTYEGVPQTSATDASALNSFQIAMGLDTGNYPDTIIYAPIMLTVTPSVIGLSKGQGIPADFIESDYTTYTSCNPKLPNPDYYTTQQFKDPKKLSNVAGRMYTFSHLYDLSWSATSKLALAEAYDLPVSCSQPLIFDPNGNGKIEPGETVGLKFPFINKFQKASLSGITADIGTTAPGITVLVSHVDDYSIVAAKQTTLPASQLVINVAPDVPCGAEFTVKVNFTTLQTGGDTNVIMSRNYRFRVGEKIAPFQTFTFPTPPPSALVRGSVTAIATNIPLTNPDGIKTGMLIRNTITPEDLRVTQLVNIDTASPSINVARAQNGSTAKPMANGQPLVFVSVPIPDNSGAGVSTSVNADSINETAAVKVNLTNITHPRIGDLTIKLTSPGVADIIIDNEDPRVTVTGNWLRETSAGDKYGPSYLTAARGTGTDKVTFTPEIITPGPYQTLEWHPAGTNRPYRAQYVVTSSDPVTTVFLDQRNYGGNWNVVGTFNFKAGKSGSVTITDNFPDTGSGIRVAADAIKFVYTGALGRKTVTLLDNLPGGSALNRTANFINVTLSDDAPLAIQDTDRATVFNGGVYRPAEPLSLFDGQPGRGEWTLTVIDNVAQQFGEVKSWRIDISPKVPQCPPVPLLLNDFIGSTEGWQSSVAGDTSRQQAYYSAANGGRLVLHTDPGPGYRIPTWIAPGVPYVNYPNQVYRMTAWINRSGQPDPKDQSQIPNMRIRAQVRYSMANTAEWFFDTTQFDPSANEAMLANAPSTDTQNPTKYSVDFDPVDVPALAEQNLTVFGTIENYSIYPNEQGNIEIAETVIERYSAPKDSEGALARTYSGADFSRGTVTARNYNNPDPNSDTPEARPRAVADDYSITLDSTMVPNNGFSYVSYDFVPLSGNEPLLKPNKMYRVRYHVSSDTNANNNPQMRLRARAMRWGWANKLEVGSAKAAGELTNLIASQALPGAGTLNPDTGGNETNGGYYTQYFNTPAVLPENENLRRLRFGFDLVDGVFPNSLPAQSNVSGRFTLDWLEVMEFDQNP